MLGEDGVYRCPCSKPFRADNQCECGRYTHIEYDLPDYLTPRDAWFLPRYHKYAKFWRR